MIVKDSSVFTYRFTPKTILHRERELTDLEQRMNRPIVGQPVKNTIIYGSSGTGKTLISTYLANKLARRTSEVLTCYVRLKTSQSEYKAINQITRKLMNMEYEGRASTYIYNRIFDYIKQIQQKYIVFIIDEIDNISTNLDIFLDAFLRPYENYNLGDKEVSVIFISNKMTFPDQRQLSMGTRSSFSCMDKLIFSPYDANHLIDILKERAEKGLCECSYDNEIISLCAAYGSKEHGDARRTIELLGKAADLADREKVEKISEIHVKDARELIEFEGISQVLKTLPYHEKAVVLAIVKDIKNKYKITPEHHIDSIPTTGSIYDQYRNICHALGSEALTQRRIRDYLDELESLGLIHIQVVYKGRYGRNAHIELEAPVNIVEKVITEDITFSGFKPKIVQEKLII